jgi:hypothetical protein
MPTGIAQNHRYRPKVITNNRPSRYLDIFITADIVETYLKKPM